MIVADGCRGQQRSKSSFADGMNVLCWQGFPLPCSVCQISWVGPTHGIFTGFNWVGLGTELMQLLERVGGVSWFGLGDARQMSPMHAQVAPEPL